MKRKNRIVDKTRYNIVGMPIKIFAACNRLLKDGGGQLFAAKAMFDTKEYGALGRCVTSACHRDCGPVRLRRVYPVRSRFTKILCGEASMTPVVSKEREK